MNGGHAVLRLIPRNHLPTSVQLMTRASDHPASKVLDYIAKCEHAAALSDRRDLVLHYHAVWILVFERAHGLLPLPILAPTPKPVCPLPEPARLKGWEKQKYASPVRKVTARREEAVTDEGGTQYGRETVLTLDCGHEVAIGFVLDEGEQPRRRRCKQCANLGHAQRVELQRFKGTRQ